VATKRDTGIHVENVNLLMRTMRKMGDDAVDHNRDASRGIAEAFLRDLTSAADTPQASAVASAFKVYRDQIPKVGFPGGASTGVSGGARAGQLFYGAEFGSGDWRFGNRMKDGTFFYPTLRREGADYAKEWFDVIADVMGRTWNKGAGKAMMS
jgi:hypothetical protein